MRRFWRSFMLQMAQDDLFVRVGMLVLGAPISGFGVWLVWQMLKDDTDERWVTFGLGAVGLVLALWGSLLMSRCFVSAQSQIAHIAQKAIPDGAGEDGLILGLLYAAGSIPVAIITLLLRWLGVKGQRCPPPERTPSKKNARKLKR